MNYLKIILLLCIFPCQTYTMEAPSSAESCTATQSHKRKQSIADLIQCTPQLSNSNATKITRDTGSKKRERNGGPFTGETTCVWFNCQSIYVGKRMTDHLNCHVCYTCRLCEKSKKFRGFYKLRRHLKNNHTSQEADTKKLSEWFKEIHEMGIKLFLQKYLLVLKKESQSSLIIRNNFIRDRALTFDQLQELKFEIPYKSSWQEIIAQIMNEEQINATGSEIDKVTPALILKRRPLIIPPSLTELSLIPSVAENFEINSSASTSSQSKLQDSYTSNPRKKQRILKTQSKDSATPTFKDLKKCVWSGCEQKNTNFHLYSHLRYICPFCIEQTPMPYRRFHQHMTTEHTLDEIAKKEIFNLYDGNGRTLLKPFLQKYLLILKKEFQPLLIKRYELDSKKALNFDELKELKNIIPTKSSWQEIISQLDTRDSQEETSEQEDSAENDDADISTDPVSTPDQNPVQSSPPLSPLILISSQGNLSLLPDLNFVPPLTELKKIVESRDLPVLITGQTFCFDSPHAELAELSSFQHDQSIGQEEAALFLFLTSTLSKANKHNGTMRLQESDKEIEHYYKELSEQNFRTVQQGFIQALKPSLKDSKEVPISRLADQEVPSLSDNEGFDKSSIKFLID